MANKDTPYRNTPKIGDDSDSVGLPSSYKVIKLNCINHDGASFDISQIVISLTITEELFSPILILNLQIRDTINFFEDFALTGQEIIDLHISKVSSEHGATQDIKLQFNVKEYPLYEKSATEPNVQSYSVVAISPFSYNSMLTRISRSVKGNPIDNITRIFSNDLSINTTVKGVCSSPFDGIITIQSPLKAVEWLRTKAYDEAGAPFFIFSNISTPNIQISSLSEIWTNNPVYKQFKYRQFLVELPNTPASYVENSTRVLDMRSNIKLDKLGQAIRGAFSSITKVTDVANKSFSNQPFDYTKENLISLNPVKQSPLTLSQVFSYGTKTNDNRLSSELAPSNITTIDTNSFANYKGELNSSTGPLQTNIARAKSYYATLDAVSHQIQVYGDFNLNPGKKINIQIPKAVNFEEHKETTGGDAEIDKAMSGDYIVAVAAHVFSSGMYTSKLKIIKDSI